MTQRTWFITGVNSGFGRLMTEQLLARGDRVAGTVRNIDAMGDLKNKYGDLLWLARMDMTNTPEIQKGVAKAFADLGKIDVIVSNAGYGLFGAAEELSDDQVLHQISTNLVGPIMLIRAALPHLRKQGGGRIIGLSTYGGLASLPGGSLYHAGKWGLEGFLDSMSQELAVFKIGVLDHRTRRCPHRTFAPVAHNLAPRWRLTMLLPRRWFITSRTRRVRHPAIRRRCRQSSSTARTKSLRRSGLFSAPIPGK